jgi:hypothetical protein
VKPDEFRDVADEPTAADLAAIEQEWPVIEAELAQLDAEISALFTGGQASELDRRRVRRAQRRAMQVRTTSAATSGQVQPRRAAA